MLSRVRSITAARSWGVRNDEDSTAPGTAPRTWPATLDARGEADDAAHMKAFNGALLPTTGAPRLCGVGCASACTTSANNAGFFSGARRTQDDRNRCPAAIVAFQAADSAAVNDMGAVGIGIFSGAPCS